MTGYINRNISKQVAQSLKDYPVVAILGPRQVGKSTLAKKIIKSYSKHLYLDLERPSDLRKLEDAEYFLEQNRSHLVCLDEIQRLPEIFPLIRSLVDERKKNGQFLVLGSVSGDLLRQSSESLAGRIAYLEMSPFLVSEIKGKKTETLWNRGGLPRSYLLRGDEKSFYWRENYIRTFLERDIARIGIKIQSKLIERLWTMLAHSHGQTLNSSKLATSVGVSSHTINSYIRILEQAFLIRSLPAFSSNLKKMLIKSPKIYIRDSGILHALLGIETLNNLFGHPIYGHSFEGFVIENIMSHFDRWKYSFYRARSGSEIDLVMTKGSRVIALEIKTSKAPVVRKGFVEAVKNIRANEKYVIAPVSSSYAIKNGVTVTNLKQFIKTFEKK